MPEGESPEQKEAMLFEQLHDALFGQLEELVNEAEDLAEDAPEGVVAEGGDEAQLWGELQEKYTSARHALEQRDFETNNSTLYTKLLESLIDLKRRAEAAYGAKLE